MAKPKLNKKNDRVGSSGINIFHGVISGEEYNYELSGSRGLRIYDEMSNDYKVEQSLWAMKYPVIQSEWYVTAASDSAADVAVKEFVHHNLLSGHIVQMSTMLEQVLDYMEFGFNVGEMVFGDRLVDGQLRKVFVELGYMKPLSIEKWETEDKQPGVSQRTSEGKLVSIPEAKLLRFTHRQKGNNYEGKSILRSAYKPWDQKLQLENIEMIGYDRQALGIPVAAFPPGISTKELDKMENLLKNLRASADAYMMYPMGVEFGWKESNGSVVKEIKNAIAEKDAAILARVFASFLDLGRTASGNRATSEDQSKFFVLACTAVADYIRDVINLKLIPAIVDANFSVTAYPRIEHGDLGDDNLLALSDAIGKYVAAGALTPRPEDENIIRKQVGWPELSDEEVAERKKQGDDARALLKKAPPVEEDDDQPAELEASARAMHARIKRKLYVPPRRAA